MAERSTQELKDICFRNTVVVGYTDVAAIGSRALLGIDSKNEYHRLLVPAVWDLQPSCVPDGHPTDQQFDALHVYNCKYQKFSIVVVNGSIFGSRCHYVAGKIFDICSKSNVEKIIFLTALNIESPDEESDMFENTLNDTSPITSYPPLPSSTEVCDPFFSTFVQMIQVVGVPGHVFSVVSHKVVPGKASFADGTIQKIHTFQSALSRYTLLAFDLERSQSMIYCACPVKDGNHSAAIYI